MTRWVLALLVCLVACGCSADYWLGKTTMETRAEIVLPNGYKIVFRDTKDNNVDVTDLKFNTETKEVMLGKLSIVNNASIPIGAEVPRITAAGIGQMSQVAYLNGVMQGIAGILGAAGQAAPGFSWLGAGSGGGGTSSASCPWAALLPGGQSAATGVSETIQPAWVSPYTSEDQAAMNAARLEAARLQAEYNLRMTELMMKKPATSPATQPVP